METKTNTSNQTLYQYVLNNMCARDFNTLKDQLQVTQRMSTVRLRNPRKMDSTMICKLAEILKVTPKFLIETFEAGADQLGEAERNYFIQPKKEQQS